MSKRMLVLMCSILLIVPLLFMGCSGDDGSDGTNGINGTNGVNGINGSNGVNGADYNTNESCMVCHTTGRIADISDLSTGVHYASANSLPNLTVGNLTVTDDEGGYLVVSFNVKVNNTTNYPNLTASSVYFFAADLVPAGTVAAALDGAPRAPTSSSDGLLKEPVHLIQPV